MTETLLMLGFIALTFVIGCRIGLSIARADQSIDRMITDHHRGVDVSDAADMASDADDWRRDDLHADEWWRK